jgi:alkylation response protein AidB-like acyl-CoA dehydrogenase
VEPGAVVLHEEPQTRAASTIDGSRHFAVLVEARRHERASLSRAALDTFWRVGALTAAADSLGACRRLVEASRTYACERRQFGRPVAAFQALAHRIVDMDAAVQIARAALHRAAALVAADAPESAEAVCVAKATTGAAVRSVSRDAVQVHGAIGYTWEHDLHLWARRAYVSDRLFGSGIGYELALARLLA